MEMETSVPYTASDAADGLFPSVPDEVGRCDPAGGAGDAEYYS